MHNAQRAANRPVLQHCVPHLLRNGAWCIAFAFAGACGRANIDSIDAGSPRTGDATVGVDAPVEDGRASTDAAFRSDGNTSGHVDPQEAGVDRAADAGAEGGVEPPSCSPGGAGRSDCGASHESCCASLPVPGGTFFRTYDPVDASSGQVQLAPDGGPGGEADPAQVSSFRLDKYLVTVGRFREFVQAWNGGAGWLPAGGSGRHTHLNGGLGLVDVSAEAGTRYEAGWVAEDDGNVAPTDANLECDPANSATWTPAIGSQEGLPINCVNWYEAYAFCIWDGGFLPSEAEWIYAAAGGAEQRQYPWGSAAPGTANQYAIYDCYYRGAGPPYCTSVVNIAPVGAAALGVGLWGQLDLTGDEWEWNLDGHSGYATPCSDCALLGNFSSRAVHGGDFGRDLIRPSIRGMASSTLRNNSYGIRCARAWLPAPGGGSP
ncbi:MAG: formylglycine-generating enzyme family protein [Polyangiaceae bacterium]